MASRLQDVILRGTAASRPLATAVAPGTLYYSTDSATTARSNGTVWETYADGGGGGGGAPAAHAPSHLSAGSDPVDVKLLGGYPANSSLFLNGVGSFSAPPGAAARYGSLTLTVDGNGAVITTGIKGFYPIPFACTILDWTLLSTDPAVIAGSIVMDIWKSNFGAYPPTVANSITAAAKPTLSAVNKNTSSTLTGWSPNISAGEILGWNVDLATSVTRVTLTLKIQMV